MSIVLDDDKLEDKHWRAELCQVEVFENERLNPNSKEVSGSTSSSVGGLGGVGLIRQQPPNANDSASAGGGKLYRTGWGKSNLKSGERKAWTRGRDGWSGIAEGGDVRSVFFPSLLRASVDSHKSVAASSCLTFDLDEGWFFVETEDWRPDLTGSWLPCGADDSESFVLSR